MQPAVISNHTHQPGKPEDWNEKEHGHVAALCIRAEVVSGVPFMRSAWETEPNEAAMLFAGAKVHLGVAGTQHPVVNLSVRDLPDDFDPVVTARRFHCPQRGLVARVEALFPHPPGGLRVFAERAVVSGFTDAFASALEAIEKLAKERGINL